MKITVDQEVPVYQSYAAERKTCTLCDVEKPLSEFYADNRPSARGAPRLGRTSRCKTCKNRRLGEINATERVRRRRAAWQSERYAAGKAIIDAAKDRPCSCCGVRYPPVVMDLHHRDPAGKDKRVSRLQQMRPDRIRAEIAKCDVLCANCHRLEHAC